MLKNSIGKFSLGIIGLVLIMVNFVAPLSQSPTLPAQAAEPVDSPPLIDQSNIPQSQVVHCDDPQAKVECNTGVCTTGPGWCSTHGGVKRHIDPPDFVLAEVETYFTAVRARSEKLTIFISAHRKWPNFRSALFTIDCLSLLPTDEVFASDYANPLSNSSATGVDLGLNEIPPYSPTDVVPTVTPTPVPVEYIPEVYPPGERPAPTATKEAMIDGANYVVLHQAQNNRSDGSASTDLGSRLTQPAIGVPASARVIPVAYIPDRQQPVTDTVITETETVETNETIVSCQDPNAVTQCLDGTCSSSKADNACEGHAGIAGYLGLPPEEVPPPGVPPTAEPIIKEGDGDFNKLFNGNFEFGFYGDSGIGGVPNDWGWFLNQQAYGKYTIAANPDFRLVCQDEIEGLGGTALSFYMHSTDQPNARLGIYQIVDVTPGQIYLFSLQGAIQRHEGASGAAYNHYMEIAFSFGGSDDWRTIDEEDWIRLPWKEQLWPLPEGDDDEEDNEDDNEDDEDNDNDEDD